VSDAATTFAGLTRAERSEVRAPTSSVPPRVVLVSRETDYELLLQRHGTRGQAKFWLESRGRTIDELEARHHAFEKAWQTVLGQIPIAWRQARVKRHDLDRFLFEPSDTVVAVGQDGLVPNVAKYLDGQLVFGVNPAPTEYEGVLVRHRPEALFGPLVHWMTTRRPPATLQRRTMAQVELDDGQKLLAVNEFFIGHIAHQSAKYRISFQNRVERQSSSGIIVTTGTGSTGWARSIHRNRVTPVTLPTPEEARLAFFVREAWPSIATSTDLTDGSIGEGEALEIISDFNEDGVIYGDGIDTDRLAFHWGMTARITVAPRRLLLA
jgi:NAD kinase